MLLAAGILGATVMPHVIYLHSALTQRRVVGPDEAERRKIFRFERIDVIIAMAIAGRDQHVDADHRRRHLPPSRPGRRRATSKRSTTGLGDASSAITPNIVFGIALLASGLSSS